MNNMKRCKEVYHEHKCYKPIGSAGAGCFDASGGGDVPDGRGSELFDGAGKGGEWFGIGAPWLSTDEFVSYDGMGSGCGSGWLNCRGSAPAEEEDEDVVGKVIDSMKTPTFQDVINYCLENFGGYDPIRQRRLVEIEDGWIYWKDESISGSGYGCGDVTGDGIHDGRGYGVGQGEPCGDGDEDGNGFGYGYDVHSGQLEFWGGYDSDGCFGGAGFVYGRGIGAGNFDSTGRG